MNKQKNTDFNFEEKDFLTHSVLFGPVIGLIVLFIISGIMIIRSYYDNSTTQEMFAIEVAFVIGISLIITIPFGVIPSYLGAKIFLSIKGKNKYKYMSAFISGMAGVVLYVFLYLLFLTIFYTGFNFGFLFIVYPLVASIPGGVCGVICLWLYVKRRNNKIIKFISKLLLTTILSFACFLLIVLFF